MPSPVTRRAHAKLNLALWVGDALPPGHPGAGFHPICSWMACIDLCDEVTVQPMPPGSPTTLSITWAADAPRPTPIDWPHERDLTLRALRALETLAGRPLPARVLLHKRIPVGAGLGGGSADAAAALTAAADAFSLNLSPAAPRDLAPSLGSDVSFFLDDAAPARPAIVSGLGERVERLGRIPGDVILVVPPYTCATAPVYAAFDALDQEARRSRAAGGLPSTQRGEAEDESLVRQRADRALERHRVEGRFLFNALTGAAARVEPRLRDLLTTVTRITNCHARLTGSGSCIFLPVETGRADRVMAALETAIALPEPALAACRAVRARLL